jgi:quercetin dioxygenase-like cupin family protein
MIINTILSKATGSIRSILFEVGEVLTEKIIPFDTLIQIMHGRAEVVIDGVPSILKKGQSIIIPANAINTIRAIVGFSMISTIIKYGYEEVS